MKIDPGCPLGDKWPDCAKRIAKSPSETCFEHGVGGQKGKECCESCKGVKIDPVKTDSECPLGDTWPICANKIAKSPSETCFNHGVGGQKGEECCESCKGVKIDPECPLGDQYRDCAERISQSPSAQKYICTAYAKQCCESCKGVKIDSNP